LRWRARLIAACRQSQRAGSTGDQETATVGSRQRVLLARHRPVDPASVFDGQAYLLMRETGFSSEGRRKMRSV
jgi:hypothetical protein